MSRENEPGVEPTEANSEIDRIRHIIRDTARPIIRTKIFAGVDAVRNQMWDEIRRAQEMKDIEAELRLKLEGMGTERKPYDIDDIFDSEIEEALQEVEKEKGSE